MWVHTNQFVDIDTSHPVNCIKLFMICSIVNYKIIYKLQMDYFNSEPQPQIN